MSEIAYVIMKNDYPEAVVLGTEVQARIKARQLKRANE